jgi:hypothetical protein
MRASVWAVMFLTLEEKEASVSLMISSTRFSKPFKLEATVASICSLKCLPKLGMLFLIDSLKFFGNSSNLSSSLSGVIESARATDSRESFVSVNSVKASFNIAAIPNMAYTPALKLFGKFKD